MFELLQILRLLLQKLLLAELIPADHYEIKNNRTSIFSENKENCLKTLIETGLSTSNG